MQAIVSVIMGSKSDLVIMQQAADALAELGVPYEIKVVSAHRTPERMFSFAKEARSRGIKVIIAGAGGAAQCPGPGQSAGVVGAAGGEGEDAGVA